MSVLVLVLVAFLAGVFVASAVFLVTAAWWGAADAVSRWQLDQILREVRNGKR